MEGKLAECPKVSEAESPELETSTLPGTRMALLLQLSSDEPQPQQHQVVAGKAGAGRGMAEAGRGMAEAGRDEEEQFAEAEAVMAANAAAVEYYYQAVDGQQHGPGKMQHLVHAWRQGSINASSLVWWSGQVGWAPLSQMPSLVSNLNAPQREESTACQKFILSDQEDEYEDVQTPPAQMRQSLLALSAGVRAKVDSAGLDALAHSWVSALTDAHAEEVITKALSDRVRNRSAFATRMARALWHLEEEQTPHCRQCPLHCPEEAEAPQAEESAAAEAPPAEAEAPAEEVTEEGEDAEAPQAEESAAAEAPPAETEAPAQEGTEDGEDAEAEEGYDRWPDTDEGS